MPRPKFQLKKFLTDNKIYVEMIVATSLSFMAIYVSVQANRIAETQTNMMEQQSLPRIEIQMFQQKNDSTNFYDNDVWYVNNRGGKLSYFDIQKLSFVRHMLREDLYRDTIIVPVTGYLNWRGVLSGEVEGEVNRFDNDHNGLREFNLADSLSKTGMMEMENYCMISYTDVFNKRHYEYYRLSPSIQPITKEKWDYLERIHTKCVARSRYFKRLTVNEILSYPKSPLELFQ
jgi:hypothetical protein